MNYIRNLQWAKDKNGRGNPILLVYGSLHRNGSVNGRPQATHPKSPTLKSPMKPKDFLDNA